MIQAFFIGLVFSFLGSIPPGPLNILVLQLGLQKKTDVALRFALAVAIVEYPYAWIAVVFENLITSSPLVIKNFQLLGASVMTAIGILNLWAARKPSTLSVKLQESGFVRGLILSILNPQAIPFWIAITAYVKMQGWLDLSTQVRIHSYVLGTSVGAMLLLTLVAYLARRISVSFQHNPLVKFLPGTVLLLLGFYGLLNLWMK